MSMPRSSRSGSGGRSIPGSRWVRHRASTSAARRQCAGSQNSISGSRAPSAWRGAPTPASGVAATAVSHCTTSSARSPWPARSQRRRRRSASSASPCSAKPSPASHSSCSCRKLPDNAPRGNRCQAGTGAGSANRSAVRPEGTSGMAGGATGASACGTAASPSSSSAGRSTCVGTSAPAPWVAGRTSCEKLPMPQRCSNVPAYTGCACSGAGASRAASGVRGTALGAVCNTVWPCACASACRCASQSPGSMACAPPSR